MRCMKQEVHTHWVQGLIFQNATDIQGWLKCIVAKDKVQTRQNIDIKFPWLSKDNQRIDTI